MAATFNNSAPLSILPPTYSCLRHLLFPSGHQFFTGQARRCLASVIVLEPIFQKDVVLSSMCDVWYESNYFHDSNSWAFLVFLLTLLQRVMASATKVNVIQIYIISIRDNPLILFTGFFNIYSKQTVDLSTVRM